MAPGHPHPQITGTLMRAHEIELAYSSNESGRKELKAVLSVDQFNLFDITFHVTIAGAVKTFNSLPSAVRFYDSAGKP